MISGGGPGKGKGNGMMRIMKNRMKNCQKIPGGGYRPADIKSRAAGPLWIPFVVKGGVFHG